MSNPLEYGKCYVIVTIHNIFLNNLRVLPEDKTRRLLFAPRNYYSYSSAVFLTLVVVCRHVVIALYCVVKRNFHICACSIPLIVYHYAVA